MPPLPRATCHVCGRSVPTRVGGELRDHRLGDPEAPPCAGSGQVPPAAPEDSYTPLTEGTAEERAAHMQPVVRDGVLAAPRTMLRVDSIRTDGGTQARVELDSTTVFEYMDALIDGVELPPVTVFVDAEEQRWLADGFHRLEAARRARHAVIHAEVRFGSLRDAVLHAAGANASHGLRRTNADKRKAVHILLGDEEWSQWSNRRIAQHAGVSHVFVANVRRDLEAERSGAQLDLTRPTEPPPAVETVTTPGRPPTAIELGVARERAELDALDLGDYDPCVDLSELRAGRLTGWPRAHAEQRVRGWMARLAMPGTMPEPGVLVSTAYGTGPYVVQSVHREAATNQVTVVCRAVGDHRAGPFYLNGLRQDTRPGCHGWCDAHHTAAYFVRSPVDVSGLVRETSREARERRERGEALAPAPAAPLPRPRWAHLEVGDQVQVTDESGEVWTAEVAGGGEKTVRIAWDGTEALVDRATGREFSPLPGSLAVALCDPEEDEPRSRETENDRTAPLRNGERAHLDAYWTPLPVARACVRWLLEHVLHEAPPPSDPRQVAPTTVVEPSVGGGAWVQALHEVLPSWAADRVDLDPVAPGLESDLRQVEDAVAHDWLLPLPKGLRRHRWRMCVGNRPYSGRVEVWVERCLERADIVAQLERSTILGGRDRWSWWQETGRPAHVVNVGRVLWEGPGARDHSDFVDSYLLVWVRGYDGPTLFHWLDLALAEAA